MEIRILQVEQQLGRKGLLTIAKPTIGDCRTSVRITHDPQN
jgi:hypothetical protein